jgi:hypothetical protein
MDRFAKIRPYNDDEVRSVLNRLLFNREFLTVVARLRFPYAGARFSRFLVPLVGWVLRRQLADVHDINGIQSVLKPYMENSLRRTTSAVTVSGVEQLQPGQPYLFMSNHRDIAMDPAFIDYSLVTHGHETVRIAIGDNLLTKDYASDLMRLNKSFIVQRSQQGPRQMLAGLRLLSEYVHMSITQDCSSVWIAQREGRAKDGFDQTEPAIIKMLSISQKKTGEDFADFIGSLNIVPVSISYEYDPLDQAKANELEVTAREGAYEKGEQEDVLSIAQGIDGQKGAVHIAYGTSLGSDCQSLLEVAEHIDRQIVANYVLHPSNYYAYRELFSACPNGLVGAGQKPYVAAEHRDSDAIFRQRLDAMPAALRPYVLRMYANCIVRKQEMDLL